MATSAPRCLFGAVLRAAPFAVLLLAACGGAKTKSRPAAREAPSDPAQAEAEALGREVVDVMDRVMAYASAHTGRFPVTVAEAGVDSLTPNTARRVERRGAEGLVIVAFRRTAGRTVARCEGTTRVLEDLSLRGTYELACALVAGGGRTFTVEPGTRQPQ